MNDVTWAEVEDLMQECLTLHASGGDFAAAGFGSGNAYGLSKACLNAYTVMLARQHPHLTINACTPGYIATDLTAADGERLGPDDDEHLLLEPMPVAEAVAAARRGDFAGKAGELLPVLAAGKGPAERILLVGLGPRASYGRKAYRRAIVVATQSLLLQLGGGDPLPATLNLVGNEIGRVVVPEPGTALLLGAGLAGLGFAGRRKAA